MVEGLQVLQECVTETKDEEGAGVLAREMQGPRP